ncbi:thioesterase [Frankia sp. CH37]|nr:thioesterase [Parafrankia sp. CH37]
MVVTLTGDVDRWIRRFNRGNESGPRLVCFPHAGGASTYFHPLSVALADVAQVVAVQYPGRQDRLGEPPLTSIAALADEVVARVAQLDDRPTAFLGHSMGSIVAFEVTRRLEADPAAPKPLILFPSARPAPSRGRPGSVHLGGDEAVIGSIAALGGTDPRLLGDPELLALILPATRADYRAIETYHPEPGATVSVPMWVTIGASDPAVTEDEALAWREHTTGDFDLLVLPGGHFYLTEQIEVVADRIRTGLLGVTAS